MQITVLSLTSCQNKVHTWTKCLLCKNALVLKKMPAMSKLLFSHLENGNNNKNPHLIDNGQRCLQHRACHRQCPQLMQTINIMKSEYLFSDNTFNNINYAFVPFICLKKPIKKTNKKVSLKCPFVFLLDC